MFHLASRVPMKRMWHERAQFPATAWKERDLAAHPALHAPQFPRQVPLDAWRQHHPEHAPEYAARREVAVILAYVVELRMSLGPG
jgi:hypothetical protein